MGLLEMSIILFTVITVGQYLVAWAAYFEKRYTYVSIISALKIVFLSSIKISIYNAVIAGASFR